MRWIARSMPRSRATARACRRWRRSPPIGIGRRTWRSHPASDCDWPKRRQEGASPRQLCNAPHAQDGRHRAVHRAAAAGPALRQRGVAQAAVRRDLPGVPADAAVVAQRDDRRARRHAAARADDRVRRAPVPRHGVAGQLPRDQSGGPRAHGGEGGANLCAARSISSTTGTVRSAASARPASSSSRSAATWQSRRARSCSAIG